MRFRISGHRWIDIAIAVIVGFAIGFFFYWLQSQSGREDRVPSSSAVRFDADEVSVRLLETGRPAEFSEFAVHVAADRSDVELVSTARVEQWIPENADFFQPSGEEFPQDAVIEVSSSHLRTHSFQATLIVSVSTSFIRPTSAYHERLPIGEPVEVGRLVIELDYDLGDLRKTETLLVRVEVVRTASPESPSTLPPEISVSCGTAHCENGVGRFSVSCSASDDDSSVEQLDFRVRLDGNAWSEWSDRTEYSFDSLTDGSHFVSIQVRDEAENRAQGTCHFTVDCPPLLDEASAHDGMDSLGEDEASLQPPTAWFEFQPIPPLVGQMVLFDASGSGSPNGSIDTYEWDFDGDGDYDRSSPSSITEYAFSHGGAKAVGLRVTDKSSMSASVLRVFEVWITESSPDVQSQGDYSGFFTLSQGPYRQAVHPIQGQTTPTSFYRYTPTHSNTGFEEPATAVFFLYESPSKEVYLFVLLSSTSGRAGSAALEATMDSGPISVEFMDDERDFRDAAQVMGASTALSWTWDSGTSDGAILGPIRMPCELTVFPQWISGIARVLFLSPETAGVEATEWNLIDPLVITGSANGPPAAAFEIDPTHVHTEMTVKLDASDSYDPNDYIVSYAWDYEGDGFFDRITAVPIHTHVFGTAGLKTVTLRVTDSEGATSRISMELEVLP